MTFHFNFKGECYNAQATIKNNNGKMCCDISGILDDKSNQQVTFKGFLLGPLVQSEHPLSIAISLGLKQYLNYYPIEHKINGFDKLISIPSCPEAKK